MQVWAVLVVALALAVRAHAQAALACRSADAARCARSTNYGAGHHVFTVQGIQIDVTFEDMKSLSIQCLKTNAKTRPLDESNMPMFETGLQVSSVTIQECPVSLHSYGALLAALGLRFPSDRRPTLTVHTLRGAESLTRSHFDGLSPFVALKLSDVGSLSLAFLEDLSLEVLDVEDSTIHEFYTGSKSFENSPLAHITLRNTTVSRVPAAVLALPALRQLSVVETGTVVLEPGPARARSPLHALHVDAADEEVMSAWAPAAEDVTLGRWAAPEPLPVPTCEHLRSLTVKSPLATSLPERWVAACPCLQRLVVQSAHKVSSLPATLLAAASNLTTFQFTRSALSSLPNNLFKDCVNLSSIDLSHNRLHVLPSAIFYKQLAVLRELRLEGNRLTAAVLTARDCLGELTALTTLVLARNPDITDNCGGTPIRSAAYPKHKGESALSKLANLETLDLRHTKVRAICTDWRLKLTHLKELDLRYTEISHLTSEDFLFSRSDVVENSVVRLEHTPLANIDYGPAQYLEDKTSRRGQHQVHFEVGGSEVNLPCDCGVYWPATALLDAVGPLRLGRGSPALRCNSTTPRDLDRTYVDTLVCEDVARCAPVPPACRCGTRATLADTTLLRVQCKGRGLDTVPRLVSLSPTDTNVTVELQLADNNITVLHLEDLPSDITTLNLSNNPLRRVEEKAALELAAAAAGGARVRLPGGRLECNCGEAPALKDLLKIEPELTCANGTSVADVLAALHCEKTSAAPTSASAPASAPGPVLGPTLGVVVLLVVLGVALLAPPGARRRLKKLVGKLREEESPRFDLFVTFGPGFELQALEVCARLEPRYVVCLQERDWVPPARIATCLAESVAASRRTVALASTAWAAALDEQTAEGAVLAAALRERRLLAVVLEPVPAGSLRRYLARHPRAALHYADPDFWQKLSAALPPPAQPSDRANVVSYV